MTLRENLVVSIPSVFYWPQSLADAGLQEPDEVDALVKTQSGPAPTKLKVMKGVALVTARFIGTLLQRLPDVADGDPVKAALGIAKLILDIRKVSHTQPCRYATDFEFRK